MSENNNPNNNPNNDPEQPIDPEIERTQPIDDDIDDASGTTPMASEEMTDDDWAEFDEAPHIPEGDLGQTVVLGEDEAKVEELLQNEGADVLARGTVIANESDSWTGDGERITTEKFGSANPSDALDTNTIDSGSMGSSQLADIWRDHFDSKADPMMSVEMPTPTPASMSDEFSLNPRLIKSGAGKIESKQIIDYRLGRLIGEGGMGEVYSAKQVAVDRMVAFKRIRKTLLETADKDRRKKIERKFLTEAHITAQMDHPNIVTIHDLGIDQDENVFYCMEYINGTEWHRVFDQQTVEQNLDILMRVAEGMAYAHSKDIIHRDLKPENVMIGKYGQVLIMDWGLAVELKKGKPTNLGGTPAYLAPEMAKGPKNTINKSSDIYLLGALLYHIATGRPPHHGSTVSECIKLAARNEIREIGQLERESLRPLTVIALKAMQTEQDSRYATIEDFQNEIRAFLAKEQGISQSYKLSDKASSEFQEAETGGIYEKYASALFGFREAEELFDGNQEAVEGQQQTKIAYATCALQRSDFELGLSLLDEKNVEDQPLIRELRKQKSKVESRKNLNRLLAIGGVLGLALFAVVVTVFYTNQRQLNAGLQVARDKANTEKVAADKARKEAVDAKEVADAEKDKAEKTAVQLSKSLKAEKKATQDAVAATKRAVDSEGKAKKAAADLAKSLKAEKKATQDAMAATKRAVDSEGKAKKAAADLAKSLKAEKKATQDAMAATKRAVDSEGKAKKAAADLAKSLKAETKAKADALAAKNKAEKAEKRAVTSEAIAVSRLFNSNINLADSLIRDNQIAQALSTLQTTKDIDNSDKYLGWEYHRLIHLCHRDVLEQRFANAVGFAPLANGLIVVAYPGGEIDLWSPGKKAERKIETGIAIKTFDVSADGSLVVIGSGRGNMRLSVWNMATGELQQDLSSTVSGNRVNHLEFAETGNRLLVGDSAGNVYGYSLSGLTFGNRRVFRRLHSEPAADFAFSSDQKQFASISPDGLCLIWDWEKDTPRTAYQHDEALRSVAIQPTANGKTVVCSSRAGEVVILDASIDNDFLQWMKIRDEAKLAEVKKAIFKESISAHESSINSLSFSADGATLLTGGDDRVIRIWDFKHRVEIKPLRGHDESVASVSVLSGGKTVASISNTGQLRVWNIDRYEDQRVFRGTDVAASQFANFSSDGKRIVSGNANGKIFVWNKDNPNQPITLAFNDNLGKNAAFMPQSGKIVTSGTSKVSVWKDGRSTFETSEVGRDSHFAVSNNERWLVTGGDGGANAKPTLLWDLQSGEKVGEILPAGDRYRVTALAISKDDRFIAIATGSTEGIIFLFNLETRKQLDEVESHRGWISDLVFSGNNQLVSADSLEGYVNVWRIGANRKLELRKKLEQVLGSYVQLSFSPDQNRFVTSSNEDYKTTLKVWDGDSFELISTNQFESNIRYVEFRKENQIAFLQSDGRHGIWDLEKSDSPEAKPFRYANLRGRLVNGWSELLDKQTITFGAGFTYLTDNQRVVNSYGNVSACVDAHFVNDDLSIVAMYADGLIRIWDVDSKTITKVIASKTNDPFRSLSIRPDRKEFAVANRTSIQVFASKTGDSIKEASFDGLEIGCLHWAIPGTVHLGTNQGSVLAFDLGKETRTTTKVAESGIVSGIAISQDGNVISTVVKGISSDETGNLIVARKNEESWTILEPRDSRVAKVSLFADGNRLVTGNQAGSVTVWQIPTVSSGQAIRQLITMAQNDNPVTGISISPDNRLILSSASDGSTVLWLTSGWEE